VKIDYGCRVARNTRLLYARLAVSVGAEMLAARLVLGALGVDDYGVFAAAYGGIGALFFFTGAFEAAARRFICSDRLNFSPLLGLTLVLCGVIGFLGVILSAAVFPQSFELLLPLLCVFVLQVLRLPFEACIVASERMGFFLALSLCESAFLILSVALIPYLPVSPLTAYAVLRLATAALVATSVIMYCRRHHEESRGMPTFRLMRIGPIFGFFGWHALGSVAGLLKGNGILLLLAAYAGADGCAACDAAGKISVLLWGLIANHRMAYLPGIVKAWTDGAGDSFVRCTSRAFRFSAMGMTLIVIPILVWAPQICRIWLGEGMPPSADMFMRMFAVQFYFEALATPLDTAILAAGRIACYEIVLTVLLGASFFLAWLFLSMGLPPWTTTGAVAVVNALAFVFRLFYRRFVLLPDGTRAWSCHNVF